jgi:hypothetical chaperone protein
MNACGLDFGTSNSAIGVVRDGQVRLAPVEGDATLMPTAVFFEADTDDTELFGREAIDAYISGSDGRLMRALKSILASPLMDETTALAGRKIAFAEVIALYVANLKLKAEAFLGAEIDKVVHGRPVHFVDGDDEADRRAEAILRDIAGRAGFREVVFVYEPVAAAYQYEATLAAEEVVLIADIGGGTSDFSVVRVGPDRSRQQERGHDILANAGIRVGGTDFDRALNLKRVMPFLGLGSFLVEKNLPLPHGPYADLATWSRVNLLYQPQAVRQIRDLFRNAIQPEKVGRLLKTVERRLGHRICFAVEDAKIALSEAAQTEVILDFVEEELRPRATRKLFDDAIADMTDRLSSAVARCLADSGLAPERINAVFLTGGSCRVPAVREAVAAAVPGARLSGGEDLVSVVAGLTQDAYRRFYR